MLKGSMADLYQSRYGQETDEVLEYFYQLFCRAFPEYTIRRGVPASAFGGESWCAPVDFLFSINNRNVLAVCICDRNKWVNKPFRGTEDAVQRAGFQYMRFIRQFSNKPDYVLARVGEALRRAIQ